ncbi:MAG: hypothetical protein IH867_04915 [Chloroflexi bacterium]|nr:hypothetical protein [Chloroflexota bacterium]
MTQGTDQSHDHAAETHRPGPSPQSDGTQYNWRIHHPFEGVEDRVAVEVAPWKGLLPRWRFVVPGDFKGVARWGIGPAGTGEIDEDVKRPAKEGPIQMVNGPIVVWFGGHESLSTKQSAYLVFEGEAPHYVAFGQAENVGGPPGNLEGISFGDDHPVHPGDPTLDPAHNHEHGPPEAAHDHARPDHAEHDHAGHSH